jgi:ArsR family transcriptional regulator
MDAVKALSALSQDGRLSVFRLLVRAGPEGMSAGDVARKQKTAANTMSAQLLVLSNAGLVRAKREGRSIIYMANFGKMSELLLFLTKDCCGGRPEICAPLAATVSVCCPPNKRARR